MSNNNKLTEEEISEIIPYSSFMLEASEIFGAIKQMQEQEEQ